ncbi:MAG TPA: response regulator [Vicinamibacterales bacterium]|nr:response regulator [Vicinamibacterales bacterium]
MGTPVRLLVIDDSEEDAELILRELARQGFDISHERVDTEGALVAALQKPWHAIISDFSMPQYDGLKAFEIVKQHGSDVPFIFVSGVLGEERAVAAMRAGAKDYVLKGKLERLGPVVSRELAEAASRRQRVEVERALQIEERRYRSIFDSAAVALVELDLSSTKVALDEVSKHGPVEAHLVEGDELVTRAAEQTRILTANAAAVRMVQAEGPGHIVGALASALRPGSGSAWLEILRALVTATGTFQKEVRIETLAGRQIDVLLAFQVPATLIDSHNVIMSMTDVTDRNSLERQIRAGQRLEAVGKLAGGIAHDFNNVLTVIEGYTEFLLKSLPDGDAQHDDALAIQDAARRAEGLTRQLLAFSRRQVAELRVVNLNRLIQEMDRLLRPLIGEDIDVVTALSEDLGLVEIDPTHVEQLIINLAVNARDAMPMGGKLTIETANVRLDESYHETKPADVPPGDYLMLAVSDNGTGMDEETRLHIFEPFFTTKAAGKGTGLGLSTAYGIVKQAGGFIWVYSELGQGTTFRIHLPAKTGARESLVSMRPTSAALEGTETILLVEDQEAVRTLARRVLTKAGYTVLNASDGDQALLALERHTGPVHAVLTDVVMPTMSGRKLADRLSALRPGVKVLYMSGYTDNAIVHHGVLEPGVNFIQKPFTPNTLLSKIREVLDAGSSDEAKS